MEAGEDYMVEVQINGGAYQIVGNFASGAGSRTTCARTRACRFRSTIDCRRSLSARRDDDVVDIHEVRVGESAPSAASAELVMQTHAAGGTHSPRAPV
jgi:hypothetical protein